MKKLLILFLLITSTISAQKKLDKLLNRWNTRNVPYISVKTLALPNTEAILLDARDKKEFEVSHLKNAMRVGYDDFKMKETLKNLPEDKNAKIVVYCSLGIRSETVAHKIIQEGYTNVFNLYGGIFEWKNADFEVVDQSGKSTEKVHTFNEDWGKWLKKGKKVN